MGHDCSSIPAQCVHDMWHDDHAGHDVIDNITYSTNYYTRTATAIIDAAPATQNLGLFLLYQGVHVPYQAVPAWESKPNPPGMWDQTYSDMLRVVDDGVANLTAALHRTKRWENTLLVVTSDNGGIMSGNNYPLRGLKTTVWEGGTKVMAFIAGGFLEAVPNFETHLKGTTNERLIHVSDWYATFSTLVSVDPSDDVVYDGVVRESANPSFCSSSLSRLSLPLLSLLSSLFFSHAISLSLSLSLCVCVSPSLFILV